MSLSLLSLLLVLLLSLGSSIDLFAAEMHAPWSSVETRERGQKRDETRNSVDVRKQPLEHEAGNAANSRELHNEQLVKQNTSNYFSPDNSETKTKQTDKPPSCILEHLKGFLALPKQFPRFDPLVRLCNLPFRSRCVPYVGSRADNDNNNII